MTIAHPRGPDCLRMTDRTPIDVPAARTFTLPPAAPAPHGGFAVRAPATSLSLRVERNHTGRDLVENVHWHFETLRRAREETYANLLGKIDGVHPSSQEPRRRRRYRHERVQVLE